MRLVRLPGQPVSEEIEARWKPVAAQRLGEDGRLPFYQMGNNLYHEGVFDLASSRAGALTLHDVWLHHLTVERTLGHQDLTGYVEALTRDHGWIGGAVALPPRWGAYGSAGMFALPVHRTLLRGQAGVLVHSEWAARVVREEAQLEAYVVPMPVPLPLVGAGLRVASKELRQRLKVPLSAPLIGSFGFQTPIKRTRVALRALAQPGLERAYLLVAGEVAKALDLEGLARQLGVNDRVRVTGFLAEDEFPVAIAACDLCVNLRYPTAGETSASLLRVLALGCPAVVSDYAQFAELPEAAVTKIPLDSNAGDEGGEVAALAARLVSLLGDRPRLESMRRAARRHVELEHDPSRAAAMMVDALLETRSNLEAATASGAIDGQGAQARDDAPVSPDRPSTLTWGWLPARLDVSGVEGPWAPGERRLLTAQLHNTGFACWLPGGCPEGGVALEVRLLLPGDGVDLFAGESWLPLPRTVRPGESHTFDIPVRRPPGASRLILEPHVIGGSGFGDCRWERWLS